MPAPTAAVQACREMLRRKARFAVRERSDAVAPVAVAREENGARKIVLEGENIELKNVFGEWLSVWYRCEAEPAGPAQGGPVRVNRLDVRVIP